MGNVLSLLLVSTVACSREKAINKARTVGTDHHFDLRSRLVHIAIVKLRSQTAIPILGF